ncbi:unnamed protein product [Acanthoscelides obtectus]|uniref:C2H2-type domain-containing protein n=1 Tax=Acanthoscelides obtectus TaxID=200917 RepID=A0A9P0JZ80_ACAOB|nr:unnamed protein product [Acanthoscelides obtectus]CAK1669659.1 Krueppel-like factor 5 [Acanthoscelides obtectus]
MMLKTVQQSEVVPMNKVRISVTALSGKQILCKQSTPLYSLNKSYLNMLINNTDQHLKEGNRYFECPKCSKTFTRKDNLKTHLKAYCGKPPLFSCALEGCDYKCKKKANLQRHYIRKHNDYSMVYADSPPLHLSLLDIIQQSAGSSDLDTFPERK